MTPNSPLNGEIKPTCHGGTVCRARRLQHGCLTKAITAPLRLHRETRPVCQCVGGYVCSYGGERGKKMTARGRRADWSVPGWRTRWPSLASDSSGQCPGTHLSASSSEHTQICIYARISLLPSSVLVFTYCL